MHELLKNNAEWSRALRNKDAQYFERVHGETLPEYLWIGCSCQDLPAHQLVGMQPSQMLVHHNLGNMVLETDMNLMACLHHAIFDLKIQQIIICGHHECKAIAGAMDGSGSGIAESWLRKLQQVYDQHSDSFDPMDSVAVRRDQFASLNVAYQATQLEQCPSIRDAQKRGRNIQIHPWVYSPKDGTLTEVQQESVI